LAPDAVEKIKYWLGRGLIGLRIYALNSNQSEQKGFFADEAAYPVWKYAGDTGLSIVLQMRVDGLPLLESMMKRFPQTRVLLDHFARVDAADGPPYAAAAPLLALARYPNLYLKLTPRPIEASMKGRATPESFFGRFIQEFGASRIMWGSNYPTAQQPLAELVAL